MGPETLISTVICLGIPYALLLYLLVRPYWRVMTTRYGSAKRLQFTLTDCWAAMFGLSPTAWVVAEILGRSHAESDLADHLMAALAVAAFMVASQVTGIVIALATGLSASQPERRSLTSALWVIGGAFAGLLLSVVGPLILLTNYSEERRAEKAALAKRRGAPASRRPRRAAPAAASASESGARPAS
jgi:hypothetical protein